VTTLRRPTVLLGIALLVVGIAASLVSWRHSGGDPASTSSRTPTSASASAPPVVDAGASSPQQRVVRLQAIVAKTPADWKSLAGLGSAYVAEAAVTGDPALYPRAEESVKRSLKVRPKDNLPATIAQSSLSAARHTFPRALLWARRAHSLAPSNPDVDAVLGDAQLELGRYDEAFATFQRMIDLRPDLPSYSRISYARELQGDIDGAVAAMTSAQSAGGSATDGSFAAFHLGELEWNRGNSEAAVTHYREALRLDPTSVRAQAALARSAFFAGDTKAAIRQYRLVVERFPLPQYVAELADIYTVTNQPRLAKEQLDLLAAQRQLFQNAGVSVDADFALINANNDIKLKSSLAAMQSEWKQRKSIFVADALAWLLQKNGRSEEALRFSDQALKLDTRNALFYFHRSEIHRSLGDEEAARRDRAEAESINPHFSILYSSRP